MFAENPTVSIEAQPHALKIDPDQTAVIVVDMQNDFGSEGGMFARAGIDISAIQAAVAPTARVLAVARRTGMPVSIRRWRMPATSRTRADRRRPTAFCISGW